MIRSVRSLLFASAALAVPLIAPAQGSFAALAEAGTSRSPAFIPATFNPPTLVEAEGFKLVPLGPALVDIDYEAYMSSVEHLQRTFTRSSDWPRHDISRADALRDMETEAARFGSRLSFAYAVLTHDGLRERGCVYVAQSSIPGYDAIVRMWVTKGDYDVGFDSALYAWVTRWMQTDWPFKSVAFPGRSIDWRRWDAAVATNAPKKGG